jgi:CTP-dependent riboflavin kinase|tara:strand:- start:71 stop:367 length:297 start_codon:yes stop_codon:yes gene_type:complete
MTKAKFIKVKYGFIDEELSSSEWSLLSYLSSLAWKAEVINASNAHLAESLGMSQRTVCRGLNKIEDLELIVRDTKNNGHYGMSRKITIAQPVMRAYYR